MLLKSAPSLDIRDVGNVAESTTDSNSDEARIAAQKLENRLFNSVSLPLGDTAEDELLMNDDNIEAELSDGDDDDEVIVVQQ